MELTAEKLTLDNIDKSTWKTYRFDQIAKNISERVEPTQTNLEIYVGLDHIDSDSIHIKRFGTREDVSGTKLRCYPGDVIFGRRRAYQRKAAIVTFDGFCSAHSLVLRANPDVILPELFPFFLHSDTFMHLAVDISVGSLSPTINWGDLKKQEFLLPPKDQQQQIAELLWAGDEMIEKAILLVSKLEVSQTALLQSKISKYSLDSDNSNLGSIGDWSSGGTPSKQDKSFWDNGSIIWVTPKDVKSEIINDSIDKITRIATSKGKSKLFPSESTIIVWRSGILQHTLPIAKVGKDFCINQDIKVFVPNFLKVKSEYVRIYLQLNSEAIRRTCVKEGTTVQSINSNIFFRYSIPILKIEEQGEIIRIEGESKKSLSRAKENLFTATVLRKSLINQFF